MSRLAVTTTTLCVCLLAAGAEGRAGRVYEDLATVKAVDANVEYRLGASGVCGTVKEDHIRVTHVIPGSPADGKVHVGDLVRGLQHWGLGDDIRATVAKRIYRVGRDWDGKLIVTVERPSARGGQGNILSLHLRLPPEPGTLQHFGPTGIYGKMYPGHVVVEKLEPGSPAEGKLQAGDRILEVLGKPLAGNIYTRFAESIDAAETEEGGGILKLRVKRPSPEGAADETLVVELQLNVLGTYGLTAPINCPKTDAIITQAADAVIKNKENGRLSIGLLGLLATGEKRYIDHVGRVLRGSGFSDPDVKLSLEASMVSWPYAYQAITLCEYYLLTKDTYVLPAIKTYAVTIAKGQDVAGLWNHRMADPAANFGKLHGRLYGYGAINQTSIALWISLILAEKCGAEHPEVRAAIEKTHALYGNWIGKGALPYGNHGPTEAILTNNGTSGSVAVGYALLGNAEGAKYYAMLSAAAYDEILTGHSGPYFNILWSGLGANVAGPEVSTAFNRKLHWLRTLNRTWDGRFFYMEARGGRFNYSGLSSTGANLLNLCTGRRALFITGKKADPSLWLKGKAADDAVIAGTIDDSKQDTAELLALLGSPLPRVRIRAAQLLAVGDARVVGEVMRLLARGSRDQRIGACHAIKHLKMTSAVDALMAIVRNGEDDLWIRELAVQTMAGMAGAEKYAPELLAIIARDKPYDVFGDLDRALGAAAVEILGPDPYALNLDKDVFYKVVAKLLDHKHMWGRATAMSLIKNIPLEDLRIVADKMVYVVEDKDRTYTSYHGDGHRQAGLEILNRLGIREVIDLTVDTIKEKTGRVGPRMRGRTALLKTFDANAQGAVPRIKEAMGKQADEIVKIIEASKTARKMISLEEAKRTQEK